MSEETQETQSAEAPAAPQEGAQAPAKAKKINRMNAKDLASKIEALEKADATGSKYYAHLLQRKREIEI